VFEQIIWLVPITVVAAGLWTPRAGLLVLVASLPFFGSPPGGPYLAALDVAALAAVALALHRGKATPSDLDWPVAGLVLVSVASLIPITYHPPSFAPSVLIGLVKFLPDVPTWTILYTWRALINLLIGWALYYAVRRTFDRRSIDMLGMAMGGGLALVLLLGLAEHAGLADLSSYRSLGGPFQETRLHSLFFHSGWLAEYIVLATPVAAVTLLMGGRWRRTGGIVLLTLALLTLPFTEQRGAWYAALAQITVLAFVLGPRLVKERKVLGPILAILLGVFCIGLLMVSAKPDVADPLVKRFSEATLDLSGRTNLWRASAQLFSERPALGWGLGAFAPAYDLIYPRGSTGAWLYRDTAHSLYFSFGAERGVMGLAALALLAIAVSLGLYHTSKNASARDQYMALGVLLSGVGFAVNGLVQDMFYLKNIEWLSWILLGIASLYYSSGKGWTRRAAIALMWATLALLPWRLFAITTPPMAGDCGFGLHEPEESSNGTMQWTYSHAIRRIPWENEVLIIPLANGHPRPYENPINVTVQVDGQDKLLETIRGGWEELTIELGSPRGGSLILEFDVHPTFRPFKEFANNPKLASSSDFRSLGIAVGEMRWEALNGNSNTKVN